MFNFSRGFCVTSTALGFRGRGSSSSNKGKRKSQDKNAPGMKKNRQGQKQYLEKSAAEGGDHFLYSPEQDMKAATEEVRQQKKEGIQGKNLAMKRAKLYKPAPGDKGAMFKDRIAQMTPEEKLTKQVYLPFGGEEHPRACSILRDVEEMTQLHLEAEKHADDYVSVLRDLVAQATVAKHYVNDGQTVTFFNTMNLLRVALADLGYVVRTPEFKHPAMPEYKKHPPFILAQPKNTDPRKPTVLVHAHYDTVGVSESGWAHAPHQMGRKDGILTGRGVATKSVVAAWIAALTNMARANIPSSVNVKFCFDPMGELGSGSLDACLTKENTGFFTNISAVVVCQGQWMTDKQPNIVYGQRGVHNYYLNIKGGEKRLDAGHYGGLVREPMIELMHLMSNLTALDQTELLPRVADSRGVRHVADVCEEEAKLISDLDVTTDHLKQMLGVSGLNTNDKIKAIQQIWREPSISITSIKSGFEPEEEYQTTIPKHATARFSIRTVPNMDMTSMDILVEHYFATLHKSMNTHTELSIRCLSRYPWWLSTRDHWNYDTAQKALKSVWKVKPDLTREGGTSPAAALFEKHLRTNVLCLPIGKPSDQPRTVYENFDEVHYINAIKTFCSYMYFAGEMASSSDKFITSDTAKGLRPKRVNKNKKIKSKMGHLIPTKPGDTPDSDLPQQSSPKEPQLLSIVFRDHVSNKNRKRNIRNVKLDVEERENDVTPK